MLAAGFFELNTKFFGELDEVQFVQQFANGFSTHVGFKRTGAVLLTRGAELFFGQQLLSFQVRLTGFDHHVILEVNHFLKRTGFHVQQVAQARGHCFEEPDMDHWSGQVDVTHAFTSNTTVSDFDATSVTDHALVFHAAIFTAGTLPVLFRAKNSFAEQSIFLGAISPVVDRFRLFDFPK